MAVVDKQRFLTITPDFFPALLLSCRGCLAARAAGLPADALGAGVDIAASASILFRTPGKMARMSNCFSVVPHPSNRKDGAFSFTMTCVVQSSSASACSTKGSKLQQVETTKKNKRAVDHQRDTTALTLLLTRIFGGFEIVIGGCMSNTDASLYPE